jgi:glycolate oxidase iron-sulfur subunit
MSAVTGHGILDDKASDHDANAGYLDCIHCGLCLSSCPTYRVLGTEMDSPRGRIYLMRAFAEGRTTITDTFVEHMSTCLDCRACETACPSGVRFGNMMEEMRGHIVAERVPNLISRIVLKHVFPYPARFHVAARLLQLYRKSGMSQILRTTGLLKRFAPAYAAAEEMTPEVEFTSGVRPGTVYPALGGREGRVSFLSGCVMNSLLGEVNRATVGLLTAAGYDVVVPADQICCGALANHAGFRETASDMARTNLAAFSAPDVDAIIVNASGCSAMLVEYPLLIDGAEEFSSKVMDVASFLASTSIQTRLTNRLELRVGYDDPCHLIHAQGVSGAPRELLSGIPGVDLIEITGADECCGSAGVYNLTEPELSMEILDRKMVNVQAANLDVLVTGNPGCLFQIQYGVRRHGLDLEVLHIAEFLARAMSAVPTAAS